MSDDTKTRIIRKDEGLDSKACSSNSSMTRKVSKEGAQSTPPPPPPFTQQVHDQKTHTSGFHPGAAPENISASEMGKTRIVRLDGQQSKHSQGVGDSFGSDQNSETPADYMDDPVVGWLVVTCGPGKGASLKIGAGINDIGRTNENRLSLDFGKHSDSQISRIKHAKITYDGRNNRFFLVPGENTVNLVYLKHDSSMPVMEPRELFGGEEIELGSTSLRFVRFCDDNFSWG